MEELHKKMDKLLDNQHRFEIQQIAHGDSVKDVADALKDVAGTFRDFTNKLLAMVAANQKGERFVIKFIVGASCLALVVGTLYLAGYRLEAKYQGSSISVGK